MHRPRKENTTCPESRSGARLGGGLGPHFALPEPDIDHSNADKELQAVSWKKGAPTAEGNTKPPFEKPE